MKSFMSVAQSQLLDAKAEISRLRALLAAKKPEDGGDGEDPSHSDDEDDVGNEPGEESDVDGPKGPKKSKAKKKAKGKDDTEEDTEEEGEPAPDDEERPDDTPDKRPAKPVKNDDREEKDAAVYWAGVKAQVAAVVAADAKRRGHTPLSLPSAGDNDYQRCVAEKAAAIVHMDRVRRGEIEPVVSLPSQTRQAAFSGQDISDRSYWANVNLLAAAVLEVHYARRGRKL